MVDIKFFRASTVTHASLSERGGLADRGFARELSEASRTSIGALHLRRRRGINRRPCPCSCCFAYHHRYRSFPTDGANLILEDFSEILLMMTWDKRTVYLIVLVQCPTSSSPKAQPTKGHPGLWIGERLSDGQVSSRSKSNIKRKRMQYESNVSDCQPLSRGG